jgi:hypothetical protein
MQLLQSQKVIHSQKQRFNIFSVKVKAHLFKELQKIFLQLKVLIGLGSALRPSSLQGN